MLSRYWFTPQPNFNTVPSLLVIPLSSLMVLPLTILMVIPLPSLLGSSANRGLFAPYTEAIDR